ncbi:hypothetical protein C6568_01190 [Melaminivora suipulveris]|uniref:Competence protein ComEA n=1 Tax=Melaminivora suipulveris TaxID=2109913 RepID=A0A2R3Q8S3_9BURK|nr:helix-hairpin-helix domain-containing protein [Melaminivora suipulveris]AVO48027.1 hypothetical protein C6568_01190 [Melaminivora suipulveris]
MRLPLALTVGLLLAAALLLVWRPAAAQPAHVPAQQVEVNHASEAQLDGIRGLGPATTRRILAARAERPFADWRDLVDRVKGVGALLAARLSQEGLTVQGQPFQAPPAASAPR